MPPDGSSKATKPLQEIVDAVGLYPAEAYVFVQQGLSRTVQQKHGPLPEDQPAAGGKKGRKPPKA